MAELRPHYNNSGSVNIPWETAQDANLSFLARGVLLDALSRPCGWDFSIERMARSCKATVKGAGRDAVAAACRELEDAGYRRVGHENGEGGRIKRWVQFAFRPVPEWAAEAAENRAARSTKPKAANRSEATRSTASPLTAPPAETPAHTESRDAVVRHGGAIKGSKTENNTHSDSPPEAAPAPTGDGVCVEPPNGAKAFVSWNITEQQLTDGTAIIAATTHPTALALIIGDDRERLDGKAAALLARGWDRRGVERALQGRTNANTFAPVRIIEPVLDKMVAAGPPAPNPRRGAAGDANERARLRARALTVAARFEEQDDTQHGLWQLTKWIHRADTAALKAWLANPTPEVPK